jgi:hypothetical protein
MLGFADSAPLGSCKSSCSDASAGSYPIDRSAIQFDCTRQCGASHNPPRRTAQQRAHGARTTRTGRGREGPMKGRGRRGRACHVAPSRGHSLGCIGHHAALRALQRRGAPRGIENRHPATPPDTPHPSKLTRGKMRRSNRFPARSSRLLTAPPLRVGRSPSLNPLVKRTEQRTPAPFRTLEGGAPWRDPSTSGPAWSSVPGSSPPAARWRQFGPRSRPACAYPCKCRCGKCESAESEHPCGLAAGGQCGKPLRKVRKCGKPSSAGVRGG